MKKHIIVTMAAVLSATAGSTIARAADETGNPATSSQPSSEYTPLTRSERLRDYLKGTFGPGSLVSAAAHAGFDQWREQPKEWGTDSQAFGARLGNAYGKHFIRQTLQYGASMALHEDDRYFASGQTGFLQRTKYAIASTFLARR